MLAPNVPFRDQTKFYDFLAMLPAFPALQQNLSSTFRPTYRPGRDTVIHFCHETA